MVTGRKSLRTAMAADSTDLKPGDFDRVPSVVIWEMTQA
jgi:hypothetical protein